MNTLTLGSLFDGSGTAPLAATMCGITPVWASEIEPYPIRVTTARFPDMKHLGNITDINGAEVTPVDIICGGSPCQDLSVAGKQAGLHDGERSHLFFEMTRIIKEMRGATNGRYPRYIVWENVPGAFSSNKGRDFLAVLQAFAEIADPDIHVPEPKQKACRLVWKLSGYVGGDGWSLAWRTVDAQYWGVPQRRRRIYLVVDLGGECADEILFERTGVSGNSEPCGAAREETAGNAGRSVEGKNCDGCLNPWDSQTIRQYDARGVFPALVSNATGGQNRQGVVYPTIARTLTAEHDASPCIDRGYNIVAAFMGGQDAKARSVAYCDDGTTPTLKSALSGGNTVPDVVYSIQGNCIDRDAKQNGDGVSVDIAHTINRVDRHGVCAVYDTTQITSPQNGSKPQPGDPCHPLAAQQHPPLMVAYTADCRNGALNKELSGTLQAKPNGGQSLNSQNPVVYSSNGYGELKEGFGCLGTGTRAVHEMVAVCDARGNGDGETVPCLTGDHQNRVTDYTAVCVGNGQMQNISMSEQSNTLDCMHDQQAVLINATHPRKYIIRRLTPLECCRLQGFPDWWEDGVEGSDSARCKMWGNGMALPNMLHVMKGIVRMQEDKSLWVR